ncbi:hypothetical protein [Aureimonas glaciei]|uniref:Transposase n=1 Tax=Aureimonas glaciei TaxID=1776957 RepID=A0A916Y3F0_9HYPH|nr:hypothetical protein [Aureimonas glaciei]GGD28863.1 hypothetical protein GCM10011335_35030 [Aureimonas glaciei]
MTRVFPRLTREQLSSVKLQCRVVDLQDEIVRLEAENAWLRSQSSSGYARGTIKQPPRDSWTVKPETEDML